MTLNNLEWLFCVKICLRFGVKWFGVFWLSQKLFENGDFRFFRSLSSEHFTYTATRQLSRDATVDDLGDISRS